MERRSFIQALVAAGFALPAILRRAGEESEYVKIEEINSITGPVDALPKLYRKKRGRFRYVCDVRSIEEAASEAMIDVLAIDSAGGYREFIGHRAPSDRIVITAPANSSGLRCDDGTPRDYRLSLSDASFYFRALVTRTGFVVSRLGHNCHEAEFRLVGKKAVFAS